MRLFNRRPRSPHAPVEISERHGVRFMHLGGPAVQSAMRIREPWALELEYTRAMMAFLLFCPAPADMALVGLGGGSMAKFVHRHLPRCRLTALEVNPDVVSAARAYFLLPPDDEHLRVVTGDGAAFVNENPRSLDVLLVDGYDAKRIAESLASPAFYQASKAALRPGGVAVFNLWGSDAYFPSYLGHIAAVFGQHILQLPAEKKGNIVVFAFTSPLPQTGLAVLAREARRLAAIHGLEFGAFVERMRNWNPVSADAFLV
jgi:spermidine synthase